MPSDNLENIMSQLDDVKEKLTDGEYISLVDNLAAARRDFDNTKTYNCKVVRQYTYLTPTGNTAVSLLTAPKIIQMGKERLAQMRSEITQYGACLYDETEDRVLYRGSGVTLNMSGAIAVVSIRAIR